MAVGRGRVERRAAIVGVLAVAACASQVQTAPKPAAKPAPKPAVCTMDSKLGAEHPARERQFPTGYWLALLLPGYRGSGVVPRPAVDCSGRPVTVPGDGCGQDETVEVTPIERLTEKDLLVVDASDTTRLVWAMTDRLSDGEVQGPVGLVEITEHGLAVRALGVLRAYPERTQLRLARIGAGTLLVAEGERCGDRTTPEGCRRALRLLALSGDRFLSLPISDDKGVCLGSPFVPLTASGTNPSSSDRYRLETSVSFGPDEVTLREQLTISAAGASAGGFIREVRAERHLGLRDGRLVASGPALVSRWLAHGSTSPR